MVFKAFGSGGGSKVFTLVAVGTNLSLYSGNNLQYKIAHPGVFTWYDGAGGTRMTLNSTGLGVGGSPASKLYVYGANVSGIGQFRIDCPAAGTAQQTFAINGAAQGQVYADGAQMVIGSTTSTPLVFRTGSTVQATLDASGNLLVNTTSQILSAKVSLQTAGSRGYSFNDSTGGSGTKAIVFGSLGVEVGSVSITTLATTYNTLSDYRLKESVKPLSGGLVRVNALKPSIYKWKSNGSDGEGFIAHELADIVPAAVTGEKDAVNEDGTISPQGVDLSKVVPILVAAIQELTARVQTLEAR